MQMPEYSQVWVLYLHQTVQGVVRQLESHHARPGRIKGGAIASPVT